MPQAESAGAVGKYTGLNHETEAEAQSYSGFREMLGLGSAGEEGPAPIPVPEVSQEAVLAGAMLVEASKRTPKKPPATRKAVDEYGLDEELEEMVLAPGAQRDATKSPQGVRLQMDNLVDPDEDEESDEAAEGSPRAAPPAAAGRPAGTLLRAGAIAAAAAPVEDVSEEEADDSSWVHVGSGGGLSPEPPALSELDLRADADGAPQSPAAAALTAPAAAAEDATESTECQPFALEAGFDYDNVVCVSKRFEMARVLKEGEFYDCEGGRAVRG